MNIFARIRKVQEQDDGSVTVEGRAVQEVADKSQEVFDYERSKPNFLKWSSDIEKATDGKSVGNVRAMHSKVAAGKLTALSMVDAEKAIDVTAKVVDANEAKKVLEGVYTGFSIGGRYVEKWADPDNKDLTRYEAEPSEISLVDNPCIPTATFFEVHKLDGSVAQVEFQKVAEREDVTPKEGEKKYGDVKFADPKNKKYPIDTEAHIRAAWNYINKGKNSAKYSAEDVKSIKAKIVSAWKDKIDKEGPPSAEKTDEPKDLSKIDGDLKKYMGEEISDAQTAIYCLSNLAYLYQKEAGEDHPEAEGQTTALAAAIENLKNFVASEIQESEPDDVITMADEAKGLIKIDMSNLDNAVKVASAILQKAGARNSKSDMERIQGIHDHAVGLGADCSAGKTANPDDLQKRHDETLEKLQKAEEDLKKVQDEKAELEKRIKELEAKPAEPKGGLRNVTVGKEADDTLTPPKLPEVIKRADGSVDADKTAVELIKHIHKTGGQTYGGVAVEKKQ